MNFEQTMLQKELSVIPTQLSFLGIIDLRGTDHFKKDKTLHKSLRAGDEGQKKVVSYLKKYGRSHWTVLQNVWMDDFGTFENDLILITRHAIYVFEIKNYTGTFTYDEGKCFYNNFESSVNPIEQVRVCKVNLQNILSRESQNIPVKSAVIFTGDDNDVLIKSNVGEIDVVRRTQILKYIRQIVDEENSNRSSRLDESEIIQSLTPYEIPNPYTPAPLTDEEMKHIVGGIYCVNCLSFEVKMNKMWVTCLCGFKEPREEAVIRTICEYGVLTFSRNLKRKELQKFLGKDCSIGLLKSVLYRHFEANDNFSHTTYKNKNQIYSKVSDHFKINKKQVYKPNPNQVVYLRNNRITML